MQETKIRYKTDINSNRFGFPVCMSSTNELVSEMIAIQIIMTNKKMFAFLYLCFLFQLALQVSDEKTSTYRHDSMTLLYLTKCLINDTNLIRSNKRQEKGTKHKLIMQRCCHNYSEI